MVQLNAWTQEGWQKLVSALVSAAAKTILCNDFPLGK
jgi:hypothetical protein